ncbi:aspartate aminotransferase family protein [Undibacterium sp. RTI2.1]|uniref:aspartate aminotransferase family protein n=1 Tax=unclassified Undibacterium TaxID=2630295 RepID=UPI002AB44EFA|nr:MULTISPECIES: aspartate aminotransferase family protein [unclassified Undibacterium]MDY7540592.1 aspartate aminotransferase family protein [Undibacterium sp. 5I1]MEB0029744.1 aspartate aminotransferase family protein [Undibacterium sp. RTI2.1]MEB0117464.1 aspartate aminotransferase family protein [Undibacterium sp. RTI2.2]MEB0230769.1 aspartate aminotransferase family protein [Undibacterium sp. 10I3]MEB0256558.1 aspartate aminotransferase family protein [Undibacterium sp. 5I1]
MYESRPNDMHPFWMPFTANRDFKSNPRLMVSAKGMHYRDVDGNTILDGTAGLWCVPLGHAQPKLVKAVQNMVAQLDFAPTFQMGHPSAFELAERLMTYTNHRFGQVFYTNSGSEAVDSALKMALAYHRARGDSTRTRLIGRERGYHGVGFGGMSVGGIANNRKTFGSLLPGVDHLPHTHNLEKNAFTRGEPEYGAHLADELERIVALHDASTIAAVIVEPLAGSTGVLVPPKGYLKRLRELCTKHGILLIFDEVITGFGRLTTPFAFDYFDVEPDLLTVAKGLTNGVVPMGAVFSKKYIYDTMMQGPDGIELFHGYTYSGHPLACAAALATLDIFEEQKVLEHASSLTDYWADAVHSLKGLPHVIDLRNLGLIAGIELASIPGKPGARAFNAFKRAFADGILIRTTGDIIALSPPLVLEKSHIDELFGKLAAILKTLD